jgi:hypothetical protein
MKPLHIGVAAFNLLCLLALVSAFILATDTLREGLASFAVVGGYVANLLALLVSAVLLILLVTRAFSGRAFSTFREHWLGVTNGVVVLLAWALFFALGGVRP